MRNFQPSMSREAELALHEFLDDYADDLIERAGLRAVDGEIRVSDLMIAIREVERRGDPYADNNQSNRRKVFARIGFIYASLGVMIILLSIFWSVLPLEFSANSQLVQLTTLTGAIMTAAGAFLGYYVSWKASRTAARTDVSAENYAPSPSEWLAAENREALIGEYLLAWNNLERRIDSAVGNDDSHSSRQSFRDNIGILIKRGDVPKEFIVTIEDLRNMRNKIVHGDFNEISNKELQRQISQAKEISRQVSRIVK